MKNKRKITQSTKEKIKASWQKRRRREKIAAALNMIYFGQNSVGRAARCVGLPKSTVFEIMERTLRSKGFVKLKNGWIKQKDMVRHCLVGDIEKSRLEI